MRWAAVQAAVPWSMSEPASSFNGQDDGLRTRRWTFDSSRGHHPQIVQRKGRQFPKLGMSVRFRLWGPPSRTGSAQTAADTESFLAYPLRLLTGRKGNWTHARSTRAARATEGKRTVSSSAATRVRRHSQGSSTLPPSAILVGTSMVRTPFEAEQGHSPTAFDSLAYRHL
jgi:hypothetical protein